MMVVVMNSVVLLVTHSGPSASTRRASMASNNTILRNFWLFCWTVYMRTLTGLHGVSMYALVECEHDNSLYDFLKHIF